MAIWNKAAELVPKVGKVFKKMFTDAPVGKAAEAVSKEAKAAKPVEEAAKKAAKATDRNWGVAAAHVGRAFEKGVDATLKSVPKVMKGTADYAYKATAGLVHNAKNVAVLTGVGWTGWNIMNGNGLIKPVLGVVGGTTGQDQGVTGIVKDLAFGDNASKVDEKVAEFGHTVTNGVSNLYEGGRQMVGGMFNGNGMVSDSQGNYYDPTASPYPDMSQMVGGMQQGNGMVSSLMGGMNNAVNSISGGNVSKMNLVGLLLSAYMMFGRFGWMGKAASLLLGGMTLKNINNNQQPQLMPQQSYQRGQNINSPSPQTVASPVMPSEDDDNVIVRSRGM